jgi:hypothetical protein
MFTVPKPEKKYTDAETQVILIEERKDEQKENQIMVDEGI